MSNNDQYQDWFAENYPNGTEPMFSFGRKVWNACCLQGARNRKNDLVAQNSTSNNTGSLKLLARLHKMVSASSLSVAYEKSGLYHEVREQLQASA